MVASQLSRAADPKGTMSCRTQGESVRLYVRKYVQIGLPDAGLGLTETRLGLLETGLGLLETSLGLPEAGLGLPEAGLGLPGAGGGGRTDVRTYVRMYVRTDVQIPPVFYRTSSPLGPPC